MFNKKEELKIKYLIRIYTLIDENLHSNIGLDFNEEVFQYREELKKPIINFLENLLTELKKKKRI